MAKLKPKPKRARTERRAAARRRADVARLAERLFTLEPGGSPERAVTVESAAVVEGRAQATACPRCSGEHEVVEHAAVTLSGERLRRVSLRCRKCGSSRSLWFRLHLPS